ncbi:group II plp decarboxylase, putative [Pediculus humanus corporis]|uniref:Pyridoxal-dependent decarboxylase domain-containing protein 1 n=1 Tax=Pediculus humanus subsp. corporis TaxID=121224 RepID=E0VSR3_PEDHC|nr:group II plp decarboxylase, putative [Pediculus humanus corporis]EEB16419.1 group II plp decarboxylase, putative [Pediculus humanus corporis]
MLLKSNTKYFAESPKNISPVSEIEIQASQIIERLEGAVEKAVEAVSALEIGNEKDPNFKESDLGLKGSSWGVDQGYLQAKSKEVPQILNLLEDLLIFENDELDENDAPTVASLAPLSNVGKFTFIIQSVAYFANTLGRSHVNKLNYKIHNETTKWLTNLFRINDSQAFYHDEPLEGLVRLTRMLLHYKYPKFLELGFESLCSTPPVIYSTLSSFGLVQYICRQLGLPLSCVRSLTSSNNIEPLQKLDLNYVQKIINDDKNSNKVILLLFADAGTPITGHMDDLFSLQELCQKEDIWLHVKGHNLAALTLMNALKIGDSLTLALGAWLGIPGLPTVTFYRQIRAKERKSGEATWEGALPRIAGLVPDQLQKCLVALPVWFALQALGRDEIKLRIKESFIACEILWEKLIKYPCLRLLSQKPGGNLIASHFEDTNKSDFIPVTIFEVIASTVVFQFVPPNQDSDYCKTSVVSQYCNKLNSWLGQILQRDVPQINVEICELENAGLVLRICPLEAIIPICGNDIEIFISSLEQHLDILSATVRLKPIFLKCVENNPSLQLVEMDGWAGLGGVRYVPENINDADSDQSKQDLNKLNIEIVNKLRATDAAFSIGEGNNGLVCVRFGMVTADTDVEELLSLVTSIGKNVEESSKYLEKMVEIVKKGIETATVDLRKENEERLWQDGILRQVPVFGSIVNWWSPKAKESGIKGRSLNLQAGVVESTENIYRYHMQLEQGASSPPGTKSPPQPIVQTPIVTDSSSLHSRSSSHSSQLSQKSTENKNTLSNINNQTSKN